MQGYSGKMETFYMRKTLSFDLGMALSFKAWIFFAMVQGHWLSEHAPASGGGIKIVCNWRF